MKIIWRSFFVLTVALFAGGTAPSSPLLFSQSPSHRFSIAVPETSFDFSDLDLRDAQNKPVKSRASRRAMEQLFTQSLTQLLLLNLTPTKRALQQLLSKQWDLFSSRLHQTKVRVVRQVEGFIQNGKFLLRTLMSHRSLPRIERSLFYSSACLHHDQSLMMIISTQLLR